VLIMRKSKLQYTTSGIITTTRGRQVRRLRERTISFLYMFRAHVPIMRRSKLHYTTSGIIRPIGGHLVHRLREEYFMLLHVSSTCAHHEEVKITLHSLWYYHTYRWPSGAQVDRGLFHASTYFEHMCSSSGGQNCITQPLVSSDL